MCSSQTVLVQTYGLNKLWVSWAAKNISVTEFDCLAVLLLKHRQLNNPGKPDSVIHYHISEEEEMHLSLVKSFLQYFFPVFFPQDLQRSQAGERDRRHCRHIFHQHVWYTAGCLVQDRCLSVMWGLISVNQSLLFYTSCPFIQKSPEGS